MYIGKRRSPRLLAGVALGILALGALAFSACGDDDDDGDNGDGGSEPTTAPTQSGGIDYSTLGGEIRIDGSSTVFPISEAVAEEFSQVADTRVNVAFSGTGGGFERFCRGEIEISDASRPINDEETQACADAGINDIVEVRVATDALTVVAHPSNPVECLTVQQLHDTFRTGGFTQWSEVDPALASVGALDWYYPGTDSGTFDYFVEEIIEGVDEAATHRGDGTSSEDDNILAQGVENNESAIGYFGFAYFQEAGDALKPVSVDGGEGCVEPTFENALDGTYDPLSRPLFIYTRESFLTDKPEVLGFVDFYLRNAEALVEEVGYITLPDDVFNEQLAKIEPFLP